MLVYRKTAPPSVRLDDEKELLERLQQKKKLDEFVSRWFLDKSEGTLIAAFHAFVSPSDFESLLEAHLHKLIERKLPDSAAGAGEAPAVWKKGSPFRGLHAFEFEHAPVFFGRTKAVSDILQGLRNQAADGRAFVLVLGMSGGGKSSVIRAGVLPMLTQPGVIEGVALWRRAIFRPGDTPGDLFTGLAAALLRDHALPSLDTESEGPASLAQVLRDSPQSAVMLLKSALDQAAAEQSRTVSGGGKIHSRLALVIDQMEEMFTQEGITSKDRKAFANTLDALARSGRVWIIGTLRSDFYPRLSDLPVIGALKDGDGQYDLMPPVASEIGQMIRLPTRAAGLRFEEDFASSERLDDILRDAAAERPEILPLLQFTLEELYQRRTPNGTLTLEAYRELGGVEGSLAQRAETVFQELPPEVQAALPKVLNALVSVEQDGHETIGRKRAPWKNATNPQVRALLETFVAARLFVTELADDGGAVVTVAHEALLWHWPRVSEWVDQNRENLRIRGRISIAAERWAGDQRPSDLLLPRGKPLGEAETLLEQDIDLNETEAAYIGASIAKAKRTKQLKGAVVVMLALMAILAGSAAFMANQQRSIADSARARAEVDAETAKRTTEFIVDLFKVSDPSEALGNTITAREILDEGAERIVEELTDQPVTQATLMDTMGTVYTSLGLYNEAIPLLESSLETRRNVLGADNPEVAASMDHLGEVLGYRGDFEAAHSLYKESLETKISAGQAESLEAAVSLSGMAEMLMEQGKYDLAEPLYVQALELRQKFLGDTHAEVAENLRKFGLNYFYKGEFEQAESQLREAVRIRRTLNDAVNPALAQAINDLAWALFQLDELDEADALWREALDMQVTLFGDKAPQVALALNNVGLVSSVRGDLKGAEELYRRAIEVQRASVGESHPNLAMFISNLAALLYEKGDSEAALLSAKEALDLRRKLLREDHPQIADGAAMVAYWSMQMGDYAEAEALLDECLVIREKTLGPTHPDVASALTLKAGVQLAMLRFAEAYETAHKARQILESSFGNDHWRAAAAANAEGAALAGLGKFGEAEQLLVRSNEVLADAPMPGVSQQSRQRLAALYQAWGKQAEAQKYLTY
jgi:tetratricopeptide (TPR) repeat protein